MRIIFMGTPDFAVPTLNILYQNGYEIPAVVTAPDKPGGRLGILQSAVKKYAIEHGIPVLQPEKLRNPEFLSQLQALKADLQVVVAFRMLPQIVWAMPPRGTLNLHGSLLPQYRGAAPINWAIINGEKETGLTTFLLQHEIDTGDILLQETVPIGDFDTAGDLHDRMMYIGADLILKTVQGLENKRIKSRPQEESAATHAPKIFTETCQINFQNTAWQVHNFVRGLSPHPCAWTNLHGKLCKIYQTEPEPGDAPEAPGTFVTDNKTFLKIATQDGYVRVLSLQPEGKKRMAVRDFLNGHKI